MAAPLIFVSHSHQNDTYSRDFVVALRLEAGTADTVWYDEQPDRREEAQRELAEQELRRREHFIAILSPEALSADQVNFEIESALALFRTGSIRTIQCVTAVSCKVPHSLESFPRHEQPDGTPLAPGEAAARALGVITSASEGEQDAAAALSGSAAATPASDNSLRTGRKYGLMFGFAGLLVALASTLLAPEFQETIRIGNGYVAVLGLVIIAALLVLSVLVGFLPARATGSMRSAFAAWFIFCLLLNAGLDAPLFLLDFPYGLELGFQFVLIFIILGVPTLFLVVISGFVGRWIGHRDMTSTTGFGNALRILLALLGIALMGIAVWMYGGLFATFDGFAINPGSAFYPVIFQLAWWWSGNESSFVSVVIILQLQSVLVLLVGLALFAVAASWRGKREYAAPLRWYARITRLFSDVVLANAFIAALTVLVDVMLSNVFVVTFHPVGDCLDCTAPPFHPPVLSLVEAYPFQSLAVLVTSVLLSLVGFYVAWAAQRKLGGGRLVLAMNFAQMLQICAVLAIAGMGIVALWLFPYPHS